QHGLSAEVQVDFQPVGHHGLDFQRLLEYGTTHAYFGYPIARWCGSFGFRFEGVETVGVLRFHQPSVELPFGIMQLESNGMPFRKEARLVFHDEAHEQRIARPPYATLAIDKSFDPLLHQIAAHVKSTQREG